MNGHFRAFSWSLVGVLLLGAYAYTFIATEAIRSSVEHRLERIEDKLDRALSPHLEDPKR